ncbi:HAD-IIB family hydrolase [Aureibacillus halotolerans]|uniref:HAD superfamily hydrolase (TIGR01484 family) n=1 Tax=Aureibacillus halotolerans TaxID=1508390 RepID=A0A4R6U900_9BACI|nr:HAD-IIB family hydrolase [Aureibacillus halotolerans]TDQ41135.1 hypothetical protein EV213_104133 [Aureibacillus halotolerans]
MRFVFDLDGTICFRGQPVTEPILRQFDALVARGHEVIFASARPIREMLPVLHDRFHSVSLIGANGGLVSKKGIISAVQPFTHDELLLIYELIEHHKATYLIDGDWNYACTGTNHPILENMDSRQVAKCVPITELGDIIKVLILSAEHTGNLLDKLHQLNFVPHTYQEDGGIDISPRGIHKWRALQTLHVEENNFIVFGNDANDESMFQKSRHSVMIGEHPKLAPLATERIETGESCERRIIEKLEELSRQYDNVI